MKRKSPVLAGILGLVLGVFGLLYVGFWHAVLATILILVFGGITGGVAVPIIWLALGAWGYHAAKSHNHKIDSHENTQAESMNDRLATAPHGLPVNVQLKLGKQIRPINE